MLRKDALTRNTAEPERNDMTSVPAPVYLPEMSGELFLGMKTAGSMSETVVSKAVIRPQPTVEEVENAMSPLSKTSFASPMTKAVPKAAKRNE